MKRKEKNDNNWSRSHKLLDEYFSKYETGYCFFFPIKSSKLCLLNELLNKLILVLNFSMNIKSTNQYKRTPMNVKCRLLSKFQGGKFNRPVFAGIF